MPDIITELVDEVPYATPDDVLTWVRNRDEWKDPTAAQVRTLLLDRSEFVDSRTNRAWRTRRVEAMTLPVKLSHLQASPKHRRRSRVRTGGRHRDPRMVADTHAIAQLPHLHVRPISGADGDTVEVVRGRTVEDITANEGIEDGDFYIEADRGRVRLRLGVLSTTGESYYGRMVDTSPTLRISYRYGRDESAAAASEDGEGNPDGVAESVPYDIRMAVSKLVAADLFQTDQFGSILPASNDDSESVGAAANSLRETATETINEYRRRAL